MSDTFYEFDQRLRKINRKHQVLARGYTSVVGKDGLIIVKPRRAQRRRVPMKGLVMLMIGFFGFKGLMLAQLGEGAYDSRVDELRQGTLVEKSGAFVMQADPATHWFAEQLRPYLI